MLKTKKKPIISIIIPCYNQSLWLYEAIISSINSYSGKKEIIVVNDSSDEAGWNVRIREIKNAFPEIKIINNEKNKGLSESRNCGIRESSGDYIQFLDSDDLLLPNKLDVQLAHFSISNIDISISDYLLSDETLSYFSEVNPCLGLFDFNLDDFLFKWERGFSIPLHCALFKRSIFNHSKFDPDLFGKEDWVFWSEQAWRNRKIAYVNITGCIYRRHKHSMLNKDQKKMANSWKKASIKINDIVKDSYPNFLEKSMKWYKEYYS